MSNDKFEFTPTGDFITVNSSDGVITAAQLRTPGRTIDIMAASKRYDFTPQEDITPLEAVWIAHFWRGNRMHQSIHSGSLSSAISRR